MVEDQQPAQPAAEDTSQVPGAEDTKKFITWWTDQITNAYQFHKGPFDRMNEDMDFAWGKQWPGQTDKDDRYVANIVQSEIAASVSVLYAKNPTFHCKRRPRMDFAVWDESPAALAALQQNMMVSAQAMLPPDPAAQALMMDIAQGLQYRQMMDRIARTLEIVFRQQILQQQPNFKQEMKQLIRRVETCGVGYLKLDFQRLMDVKPDAASQIADVAAQLAHIEGLMKEIEDSESSEYGKQAEELRISLKTLQEKSLVIAREGLLVHFPRATAIIIDPACTQLRGFVGARWVAEEFYLPACRIYEIFKKDVKGKGKTYGKDRVQGIDAWKPNPKMDKNKEYGDMFRLWEVYHLDSGSKFTICEGFDEYLRDPAAPDVLLERFYPYYSLSFNDVENTDTIYPPSTCRLIRHQQLERNRSKEALRQHRIASKPHYVNADGTLTETDLTNMEGAPAHAIISLQSLQPGQKAEDLFMQVKKHPIDPNTYETSSIDEDVRRITRRSEAGMGAASAKVSATADTIAADYRQVEDKSKNDDIDEFLTEFARDAGQTLMLNLSQETVKKIAGPGAAWPQGDPSDIVNDLNLEIEAGSSGRPNRALEVATFQRLFPILVQTPGIKPDWLAKTAIKLSDSNIDISEAYSEGLPSIMAMNSMTQTSTGNPETDPNQQGGEGADKNARPPPAGNEMTPSPGLNTVPETATQNSILQ